jgi:hypothetical protein
MITRPGTLEFAKYVIVFTTRSSGSTTRQTIIARTEFSQRNFMRAIVSLGRTEFNVLIKFRRLPAFSLRWRTTYLYEFKGDLTQGVMAF